MALASRSFAQAQAQAQEEASVVSSITASQLSSATDTTNANEDLPGWMNHLQILQFAEVPIKFRDCILLDTQSGASLFCNKHLLQCIIKAQNLMFVKTKHRDIKSPLSSQSPIIWESLV